MRVFPPGTVDSRSTSLIGSNVVARSVGTETLALPGGFQAIALVQELISANADNRRRAGGITHQIVHCEPVPNH